MVVKGHNLGLTLAVPLINCVSSGRFLNPSTPQFSHLRIRTGMEFTMTHVCSKDFTNFNTFNPCSSLILLIEQLCYFTYEAQEVK